MVYLTNNSRGPLACVWGGHHSGDDDHLTNQMPEDWAQGGGGALTLSL